MLNKDVTHPKMRRRIEQPRIVLLDCPLEYKKGESQTNIEITKEADWNRILQIEEEQIKLMCDQIIAVKPDLVFTEKGVSGEYLFGYGNVCVAIRVETTTEEMIGWKVAEVQKYTQTHCDNLSNSRLFHKINQTSHSTTL